MYDKHYYKKYCSAAQSHLNDFKSSNHLVEHKINSTKLTPILNAPEHSVKKGDSCLFRERLKRHNPQRTVQQTEKQESSTEGFLFELLEVFLNHSRKHSFDSGTMCRKASNTQLKIVERLK